MVRWIGRGCASASLPTPRPGESSRRSRIRGSGPCCTRNARQPPGAYAIAAIPLLAEVGAVAAYPWLQRILVVDAPVALQRARLLARDGIDEALADRMIAAQASREQRLALATDVIVNDGSVADLDAPVRRLDALYRRLALGPA